MKRFLFPAIILVALGGEASSLNFQQACSAIVAGNTEAMVDSLDAAATLAEMRMSLNLPDPELEGEYLIGDKGVDNRWSVGVTQSVEWPGVYGSRRRHIDATARVLELSREITRLDAQYSIATLLIDYVDAAKRAEVLNGLIARTDSLQATLQRGYKDGNVTLLDVNKIKIERVRLASSLAAQESRMASIASDLVAAAPLSDVKSILDNLDAEYPPLDLGNRTDYYERFDNSAYATLENARDSAIDKAVDVAKKEMLPGLSLGYRHAFEDGSHFNGLAVGITLPLFSHRGAIAAVSARKEADMSELVMKSVSRKLKIDADFSRAEALAADIRQLGPIFDTTDEMALLDRARETGSMTLIDYLREVNYYLEARMNYLDLLYEYNLAAASLNRY